MNDITLPRDVVEKALDALKSSDESGCDEFLSIIDALEERLAQPEQESFSPEAIRATQAAWKMGYDAAKAEQPEQEPVAWEDVLGAIARGWTHDDNKHKTMDVRLAVAIAKEIQDMVIAPPQRKPLTDEQIAETLGFGEHTTATTRAILAHAARAIEAAHGIKGEA